MRNKHRSTARKLIAAVALCVVALPAFAQSQQSDNSQANATPLGNNPNAVSRNGMVGSADTMDFYRFSLSESRGMDVRLTNLTGNADLYVYGDNGAYFYSNNSGNTSESISKTLRSGTYYVFVYGWAGTVNYQLTVNAQGQSTSRSLDLGRIDGMGGINSTKTVSGSVGANEGWVDYKFTLPGSRNVTVNAQIASGAALSPDRTPNNWNVANNRGVIQKSLGQGRYLVRLFGRRGQTTPYTLAVMASPINTNDTAGNSHNAARDIGVVRNPPTAVNEYVGQHDFDDFYKIQAPTGSVVNVDLRHRTGSGADIYLYNAQKQLLTYSNKRGSSYDSLSYNALRGGIFYVQVRTATTSGPNWQDAQYTVRMGTMPMSVPRSGGSSGGSSRGPDGNNDINSPGNFGSGSLVEGQRPLLAQGNIGGPNDTVDHLVLNVYCNNANSRPRITVGSTSPVLIDLDRIKGINGLRVDNPMALGVQTSPPISDYKTGNRRFEYRFTITPQAGSIGATNYTISVSHGGCR